MAKRVSETAASEFDAGGDYQDDLFGVLAHPRRRFLLHHLQDADTTVSVEELTAELVAWESQKPVDDRTGNERDAITVSLVHNHLPKMLQAGVIRYDRTEQTAELVDHTDEVQSHLQVMVVG